MNIYITIPRAKSCLTKRKPKGQENWLDYREYTINDYEINPRLDLFETVRPLTHPLAPPVP